MRQKFHVVLLLLPVLLFITWLAPSRASAQNKDVVLVLPFENLMGQADYHTQHDWIGESFAYALSELLNVENVAVISNEERESIYRRMNLPLTSRPSRATATKMALESGATLAVVGTYKVTHLLDGAPPTLEATARILRVREGRLDGRQTPSGRWFYDFHIVVGALAELQNLHGRLAFHILISHDKALPYSQLHFIGLATRAPLQAFEFYIKGIQTTDLDKREELLKAAESVYAKEKSGAIYTQAAFALGELYYAKGDWKNAAQYYSKLGESDRQYVEASFKAATCFWKLNDLTRALAAIMPLTADTALTSVYNNAGAISLQAARDEKDPTKCKQLMEQALRFLQRAAEHSTDPATRFNYAHALFLSGQFAEAAQQFQKVYQENVQTGHAYFLYAKALEQSNQADKARPADDLAKRLMGQEYTLWQEEWNTKRTISKVPILLQPFSREYIRRTIPEPQKEANLTRARELYQAGQDEEAFAELRRILIDHPQNAEAYLIMGLIHQRQGNLDQAVSALKTALFWKSTLIEAHITLGRIFLERKDCQQAADYARSALALSPNNSEALALQRSIDIGGCK